MKNTELQNRYKQAFAVYALAEEVEHFVDSLESGGGLEWTDAENEALGEDNEHPFWLNLSKYEPAEPLKMHAFELYAVMYLGFCGEMPSTAEIKEFVIGYITAHYA